MTVSVIVDDRPARGNALAFKTFLKQELCIVIANKATKSVKTFFISVCFFG